MKGRAQQEERKRETRRKILVGAMVLDQVTRGEWPDKTEPEVVVPKVGGVPEAVGRADIARLAVSGATAQHTPPAIALLPGPPVARGVGVTLMPAVLHPFPHVARHVVYT